VNQNTAFEVGYSCICQYWLHFHLLPIRLSLMPLFTPLCSIFAWVWATCHRRWNMPEMLPRLSLKYDIHVYFLGPSTWSFPIHISEPRLYIHPQYLLVFWSLRVCGVELKPPIFISPLDSSWILIIHVVHFQFFRLHLETSDLVPFSSPVFAWSFTIQMVSLFSGFVPQIFSSLPTISHASPAGFL